LKFQLKQTKLFARQGGVICQKWQFRFTRNASRLSWLFHVALDFVWCNRSE